MPVAANPRRRDFYVYSLTAAGRVFYVGIGREKRAGDRIRWVRSQLKRQKQGLHSNWVRHTKVAALCIRGGIRIGIRYLKRNISRREALEYERGAIARYLRRGFVLANHHYNTEYKGTARQIVHQIKLITSGSAT